MTLETSGAGGVVAEHRLSRVLPAAVVLYLFCTYLGRQTIVDGDSVSLIWPAAGVSLLWLGVTRASTWPLSLVLLASCTALANMVTGATPGLAAVLVISNCLLAVTAGGLLKLTMPHLIASGGTERLLRLGDFGRVLLICLAAGLVGAAVDSLLMPLVEPGWSAGDTLAWWARNSGGAIAVGVSGILLADWVLAGRSPGVRLERVASVKRVVREPFVEFLLLMAFTLVLYQVVYIRDTTLPIAFPLLLATVWAGVRFRPLTVALHSLLVSVGVVALTVNHAGLFGSIPDPHEQALVSQVFIATTFLLGLLLSFGRAERTELLRSQVEARAEAQRQAVLMSTVINAMHDGVLLLDRDGTVQLSNPAARELSGLDERGARVDPHAHLVDTTGRPLNDGRLPYVRAFAGESVINEDVVVSSADGMPDRALTVTALVLPAAPGEREQAVVVTHDVTTDRVQRQALESFAGSVAHDLLNPLGVIDGWAEILDTTMEEQGSMDRANAKPMLDKIRAAADGMQGLIDDLLASSTTRRLQLRWTRVDLDQMVAGLRNVRLSDPVEARRPLVQVTPLPPVYADPGLVRQLLDNLIGNACKYVVPGQRPDILVCGEQRGDVVEITVADRGIGIPEGERSRIFHAFHRAHRDGYDGHGIGLSVCKQIVDRHGGRIAALARPDGPGTRMVFSLPASVSG